MGLRISMSCPGMASPAVRFVSIFALVAMPVRFFQ
jgi:hypothetical protein